MVDWGGKKRMRIVVVRLQREKKIIFSVFGFQIRLFHVLHQLIFTIFEVRTIILSFLLYK